MIVKISILFFILAVIATVLWCVIPIFVNKHKIKYNKQHPYRIVETGIGEYKLQRFRISKFRSDGDGGDIYEWNDIEVSADLSDITRTYNKLYDEWLKDQKERKDKIEFDKLSRKIVKVIKQ